VCLDRLDNQAGVDSAWEQKKLEARKMLENAADRASEPPASIAQAERIGARQSHASAAPRKSGGSFYTAERHQTAF